ncbi:hypothetical protein [Polyangium jinanense]|uniref:hypothetical protein n=1 Tax=Polyangium jinanense TaxID=2829994 RepID=UPI00233FB983|nr:hypothetical protein [Polyangium jinanense]
MHHSTFTTLAAVALLGMLSACGGGTSPSSSGSGSGSGASTGGGNGVVVDRGPTSISLDGDPNGLFWDADTATLFIADDNGNRILSWTDTQGLGLAAELPPAPPDSAGLGQVVKLKDGTLVVPRFGGGTAGDVVYAKPDGTNGVVPNLDPLRRRIGLTVSEDGTLYDTFFVAMNGIKLGSVAKLDLAGAETEVITGLKKPVGVLAAKGDFIVTEQETGNVLRAPIASPDQIVVIAQLVGPDLLTDGPMERFSPAARTAVSARS